jgi:hypothetical protein
MVRAEPYRGQILSKIVMTVVPGVVASAIAVFVLYSVHSTRAPELGERVTGLAPAGDDLTAEERRELTRQMLKARRENPEQPELVKPTPRPTATAAEPKPEPRTERTANAAPTAAPLPRPPRAKPDQAALAPNAAGAPGAAVPGTAANATPGSPGATALPRVDVTASTPKAEGAPLPRADVTAPDAPEQRSFAANVFSSISVFAGTAANATGNTVNWVIDLPGKAISAGGRLISGAPAAPQPAPDAPAPPPKRNLL